MTAVSNVVLEKETLRKTVNKQREPLVNCALNAVSEGLLAEMLVRDGQEPIDLSVLIVDEDLLAEMLVKDGQDMIEPSVLNVALEVTRVVAEIVVGGVDEC
jgi:hypothetical protein